MNRIRKTVNGYQVLTTPHNKYDVDFEYMLGSWTDEGLSGFNVYTYDSYNEAECEAVKHPDIAWDRLREFHRDQYHEFGGLIRDIVDHCGMTMDLYPHLMSENEIKNTMMNRVLKNQMSTSEYSDFRLIYDMNDIISFVITNPWSHNLRKMKKILISETRLNIFSEHKKNGVIHLVGRTDIGTTYEIILATDLMRHFMMWKRNNCNKYSAKEMNKALIKVIKSQRMLDSVTALE